jgi:hypothetical protein
MRERNMAPANESADRIGSSSVGGIEMETRSTAVVPLDRLNEARGCFARNETSLLVRG